MNSRKWRNSVNSRGFQSQWIGLNRPISSQRALTNGTDFAPTNVLRLESKPPFLISVRRRINFAAERATTE